MTRKNKVGLKRLLKKGPLLVPGSFDCLSALLVEKTGFKATYLTGAGLSVTHLGKPDIGLLTRGDIVDQVKRMTEVLQIPLLVDVDTGFGGVGDVKKTVHEVEKAGAAGIQIEDQEFPKRCGHLGGKSLVPAAEMVAKIEAAVSARKNSQFVIVARTDARGVTGMIDTLRRAELYKKAGADIIFPEALESRAEFAAFGRKKILGTLMANMTEFGHSPALTVEELAHLGYRLILFPMTTFRTAAFAMESALQELKKKGTSASLLKRMQPRSELYKLIKYTDF